MQKMVKSAVIIQVFVHSEGILGVIGHWRYISTNQVPKMQLYLFFKSFLAATQRQGNFLLSYSFSVHFTLIPRLQHQPSSRCYESKMFPIQKMGSDFCYCHRNAYPSSSPHTFYRTSSKHILGYETIQLQRGRVWSCVLTLLVFQDLLMYW